MMVDWMVAMKDDKLVDRTVDESAVRMAKI